MPTATYVTERFTGSDGTEIDSRNSDSDHSWTEISANNAGKITGNRLRNAVAAGSYYYSSYVPQSADYSAFCTMVYNGTASLPTYSNSVALYCRLSTDGSAYGRVYFYVTAEGTYKRFYAQCLSGGSQSNITSITAGTNASGQVYWDPSSPSSGQQFKVELRFVGSILSVYVDGTLRISGTNTSVTAAGRPGVGCNGSSTSSAPEMDDFYVVDYAAAQPRSVAQAVQRAATR